MTETWILHLQTHNNPLKCFIYSVMWPPRASSCIKHDHVNHRWELSTAFLSLWFTLRSFNISESSSLAVINNSAERILPLLRECKYIEARWCDKQPSVTLNAALIGFVQKSTSDALLTITSKQWIHLIIHCFISWQRFSCLLQQCTSIQPLFTMHIVSKQLHTKPMFLHYNLREVHKKRAVEMLHSFILCIRGDTVKVMSIWHKCTIHAVNLSNDYMTWSWFQKHFMLMQRCISFSELKETKFFLFQSLIFTHFHKHDLFNAAGTE